MEKYEGRLMAMLVLVMVLFTGAGAPASELIYRPTNPSFGGDPNNGQWLLNSASDQNRFKNPDELSSPGEKGTLESFKDSLTRQLISKLSIKIADIASNGTTLTTPLTYDLDGFEITIRDFDTGNGHVLEVTILDPSTGSTTSFQVPYI